MNIRVIIFLFSLLIWNSGISQVVSDFEGGDTDGWVSEGDGVYLWEATTGNPAGCMRVNDDATGDMNRAYAPVKFLGDWSGADAFDTLSADIFLNQIATAYVASNFVFRITGPGGQATGILNPKPPFQSWITYKISLSSADWQLNSGTWAGLMQNVTTLIITMEYISGDEFNRLDNVRISFSPSMVPVSPVVCSTFEEIGYDGWTFTGSGGVSNQSSGGNHGRFIQISNGSGTSFAVAPAKFLGDWNLLDNHGADIRFDIKITATTGSILLNDAFLRITGPGGSARIPMDGAVANAMNKWFTFSYPILQTAWTLESGSWELLIDHINSLQVCMEFTSGSETVGFDNFCITNLPAVADFTAKPQYTFTGEPVAFTDLSAQAPVSWLWDFGDGTGSNQQNPVHAYSDAGVYTVTLTVTNHFGSDSETKANYMVISAIDQCLKYSDTFPGSSISPYWSMNNGTWSVADGNIRQTSNYYGTTYLDGCFAITGSPQWSDITLSAALRSSDNDQIGLVINVQDYQNMIMFLWTLENPYRAIYRWENGTGTVLASDNVGYVTNTWYNIQFGGHNGNIILKINGEEIFNVWDATFSGGKAGLYCRGNQSSYWDNVLMECAIRDTVETGEVTVATGQEVCFEALEIITTAGNGQTFQVQNGGIANLVAGLKISMLPGTSVQPGGYLHAWITGSGHFCNAPPVSKSAVAEWSQAAPLFLVNEGSGNIKVFPNPVRSAFSIRYDGTGNPEGISAKLMTMQGKEVRSLRLTGHTSMTMDISDLPEGMYVLKVTAAGEQWTSKLLRME